MWNAWISVRIFVTVIDMHLKQKIYIEDQQLNTKISKFSQAIGLEETLLRILSAA